MRLAPETAANLPVSLVARRRPSKLRANYHEILIPPLPA
jgi:hypothetical protein